MEETGKSLRVDELLKGVFNYLAQKFHCQPLQLADVSTEIADDSDYHRTRKGYIKYLLAATLSLNNKVWLLAYGVNGGGYPADAYSADLTAIPYNPGEKTTEQVTTEVTEELSSSTYFRNSLLIGIHTGQLAAPGENLYVQTRFTKKVLELIGPKITEFTAQQLEVRSDVIFLDLRPVPSSIQKYKPEFVPVIAEAIEQVLAVS